VVSAEGRAGQCRGKQDTAFWEGFVKRGWDEVPPIKLFNALVSRGGEEIPIGLKGRGRPEWE